MRIVFDVVHPAHVHFFKYMVRALRSRGHDTAILAREKDVTTRLLDQIGLEYCTEGRAGEKSRLGQLGELLRRDLALARFARDFEAHLIVTRNPAGTHAARLIGADSIFDTDDGSAAGLHFHAARPFAHVITSPDCLPEYWGAKHLRYPGYKQTAYLHPDHFTPDPRVLDELGVARGKRFFLVRFVAMHASHDAGEAGMRLAVKRQVIDRLQLHGRVFLSCETGIPEEWQHLAYPLPPDRMLDSLAFADLCIGDSQTMAAEAAVLGTPSLRCSSFVGRISYLEELEHRYELTWGFLPRDSDALLAKLDDLLASHDLRSTFADRRARMLQEKVNVADWFVDLIERTGVKH